MDPPLADGLSLRGARKTETALQTTRRTANGTGNRTCRRDVSPYMHRRGLAGSRMATRKVTLEESIAKLAQATEASPGFVEKVRALFLGRGIDLEDSSEPYRAALFEAFRQHASIRHRLDEARASLARLHASIEELGDSFAGQLARLRAAREALERQNARKRGKPPVAVAIEAVPLVQGEYDRPLVPGPEETQ